MQQLTDIALKSPIDGFLVNLADVPDPVFAQSMVGNGIAIDPLSNIVYSPVNGVVLQLHSSKHAITIEDSYKNQYLIHVGIDTVKLKGKGFKTFVKVGDNVRSGDKLIEFDMDYLSIHAKSLITPVLLTNCDNKNIKFIENRATVNSTDDLYNISFQAHEEKEKIRGTEHKGNTFAIELANGLHARPSAQITAIAKKYESELYLYRDNEKANLKSVISLMSLEVKKGDNIQIAGFGKDAELAIKDIEKLIQEEIAEEEHYEKAKVVPKNRFNDDDKNISGLSASPGIAIGKVFQVGHQDINVDKRQVSSVSEENNKFEKAIAFAKTELQGLRKKLSADQAAIFGAHEEILDDPDILSNCLDIIRDGINCEYAWKSAFTEAADKLASLNNEMFAARANDIQDVGRRVLKILVGAEQSLEQDSIPENVILIAESLSPSDTANLDKSKVLGFATTTGGTTSHVAILARSLGIPALAGVSEKVLSLNNGVEVILDADHGVLKLDINENEKEQFYKRLASLEKEKEEANKLAFEHALTTDGKHIEVAANIAGVKDSESAFSVGCDGVGLLRSEFLFLEREEAPSESDQQRTYQNIANSLKSKPLIIRTLDVGGDKPLAYLPIPKEENPFLGERGIRVSLNNEEIFRSQIRAILKIKPLDNIKIMFPMVSQLDELLEAKRIVREEEKQLKVGPVSIGIMVEVPSTALMADTFAPHVDFFSVGANDLTQYTVAVDRGHSKLASIADGLNPAVLKLIKMTCESANRHGKWVGVCGGIASDLAAVPLLIGLGVTELSVGVPVLSQVKAKVRKYSIIECEKIANEALLAVDAKAVRALLK